MGLHPPCCDCSPEAYVAMSGIAAVGKGVTGWSNASSVNVVGDGQDVALTLLEGDPFEGSEYDGLFQTITVVAAYPISKFVDEDPPEPSRWDRTGTLVKTWTRTHTGAAVVSSPSQIVWVDTYEEEGTVGEDEAIIPGTDDDPNDFGPTGIIRAASSISTGGQVTRANLISGTQSLLPATWSAYPTAALAAGFELYPGVSSGISLSDYDPDASPLSCGYLIARWAAVISPSVEKDPPMYSPAPTLAEKYETLQYDLETPSNPPSSSGFTRISCPWRTEIFRFSSSPDLSDPESSGWYEVSSSPSPGTLVSVELPKTYSLDLTGFFV